MKRIFLISTIILSSIITVNAQWTGTNPVWTNSNVGIGTGQPSQKLEINGNIKSVYVMASGYYVDGLKVLDVGSNFLYLGQGDFTNGIYTNKKIRTTKNIEPYADLNSDLGNASARWNTIYGKDINLNGQFNIKGQLILNGISESNPAQKEWLIYHNADGDNDYGLYFKYDGATELCLRSQNVGIGTTNPEEIIHISGSNIHPFFDSYNNLEIRLNRAANNYRNYLRFETNKVVDWYVGVADSDVFGDGTDFFIGKLASNPNFLINSDGYVGIGISPEEIMHISGSNIHPFFESSNNLEIRLNRAANNYRNYLRFETNDVVDWYVGVADSDVFGDGTDFFIGKLASNPIFLVNSDGNVGIGTTSPAYKLDVYGTISASEIKVEAKTADFVFEEDYELRSLKEVENFIKENKHLPEIAPAEEMEKSGVYQSEMNQKLLIKLEEMTLYMIEMNKKVEKLEKENKVLKNRLGIE